MKTLSKKVLTFILAFSMILPIVGCANDEDYSGIDAQDFVLTIKADKEQYSVGEEILIDISLENQSGVDLKIAYYYFFYPESPTGQFPDAEQPPETTKVSFKKDEIIRDKEYLGGCFPVGEHEVKYQAVFYLGWKTEDLVIRVLSNTIGISIIGA